MPTDTERREVARRLRELDDSELQVYDMTYFAIQRAVGGDGDRIPDGRELADRLADLIEPPYPDATASYRGWRAEVYDPDGVLVSPSSVAADLVRAHADGKERDEPKVRCIAEIKIGGEKLDQLVNDAAVELTGIDRDALLALADELDAEKNFVLVGGYARRIRKALGVES